MTLTERASLTVGGVVSVVSLLASVWYAAISMNNLSHKLTTVSDSVVSMERTLGKVGEVSTTLGHNQEAIIDGMITLVYLGSDYALFRTAGGRNFKVVVMTGDLVRNSR